LENSEECDTVLQTPVILTDSDGFDRGAEQGAIDMLPKNEHILIWGDALSTTQVKALPIVV